MPTDLVRKSLDQKYWIDEFQTKPGREKTKPTPAVLYYGFKEIEGGQTAFDIVKILINSIQITRMDKARVISTFGDSFTVQGFGRLPKNLALSGIILSYGRITYGPTLDSIWENFLSASAYTEGYLRYLQFGEEGGYITKGFLHANGIMYHCIFTNIARSKSAESDPIEMVSLSGIILHEEELPNVEVEGNV